MADYRSQEAVEADFRQMKDPQMVSFSPMFHWIDHKIRVHVFYSVLALMVARLMVREADHHGTHTSVRELLETLADIQETVLLYQGERGRPRARRMLTELDTTQQGPYDLFGLAAYREATVTRLTGVRRSLQGSLRRGTVSEPVTASARHAPESGDQRLTLSKRSMSTR